MTRWGLRGGLVKGNKRDLKSILSLTPSRSPFELQRHRPATKSNDNEHYSLASS